MQARVGSVPIQFKPVSGLFSIVRFFRFPVVGVFSTFHPGGHTEGTSFLSGFPHFLATFPVRFFLGCGNVSHFDVRGRIGFFFLGAKKIVVTLGFSLPVAFRLGCFRSRIDVRA